MALPSLDGSATAEADRFDRRQPEARRQADTPPPGYEQGLQDGIAQGRREAEAAARQQAAEEARASAEAAGGDAAQRLAALVAAFEDQFAAVETALADKAIDLGVLIAGQVLAHELKINRQALIPVAQDCLKTLGRESRAAVLRVHPDDFVLIDKAVLEQNEQWPVQIESDRAITPGGCILETPHSVVDGTLQTRWRRALAAVGLEANELPEQNS